MSRNARIALVLAAVLGLVVAFVVASGSDDEGGERADDPPTTTQAATAESTPEPGTSEAEVETTTSTTTTPNPRAEPAAPLVRVEGGQPVGGVQELEFDSGERIRFRVRADAADEIHVHGYDIERALPANRTITLSFDGELEGIFEVELHGTSVQIASLKVEP